MEGFSAGQTITIGNGGNLETVIVSSIAPGRRRFGGPGAPIAPTDTIKMASPLRYGHGVGSQISGSGITLSTTLKMAHNTGSQMAASIPTPGEPNEFIRKP